jgi:hypothetical protein
LTVWGYRNLIDVVVDDRDKVISNQSGRLVVGEDVGAGDTGVRARIADGREFANNDNRIAHLGDAADITVIVSRRGNSFDEGYVACRIFSDHLGMEPRSSGKPSALAGIAENGPRSEKIRPRARVLAKARR